MTDEILEKISARRKKADRDQDPPTRLYQEVGTAKDFRLSPGQWSKLTRLDKKILHYHRIMEEHYMEEIHEKSEKERKKEQQKQDNMSKMPKQTFPARLRRGRL